MSYRNSTQTTTVVIVTYNRLEYLKKCLRGILNQDLEISNVIIVDNCSSDGTSAFLKESGYVGNASSSDKNVEIKSTIIKGTQRFTYIRLKSNEGSSGGFYEGIDEAYREGTDWIWIMDDDVAPEPDCLRMLHELKKDAICIHPVKKFDDGTEQVWEGIMNPETGEIKFLETNVSFERGSPTCRVNYACFEGALFHRDAVSKVGLPDKRFFIAYDDRMWGYLLSLHEEVLFTNRAVLNKLIDNRAEQPNKFRVYFRLRNYFIIDAILKGIHGPSLIRKIHYHKQFLKFWLKGNREIKRSVQLAYKDGRKKNFFEGGFFRG